MLNHLRTLLHGSSGLTPQDPTFPGEERIPAAFRPSTTYSPSVGQLRKLFLGTAPDRLMKNYRVFQLLKVVHGCGLDSFVTQLDPRISYRMDRRDLFASASFQPLVSPLNEDAQGKTAWVQNNEEYTPDTTGRTEWIYNVTLSGDGVTATVDGAVTAHEAVGAGAYAIALPSTRDKFFYHEAPAATWAVRTRHRPRRDLGGLLADALVLPHALLVFGTEQAEPWATFRSLFFDQKDFGLRLAGLILALGYRTDKERNSA